MSSTKRYALIVLALLLITGGLIYIDYQVEQRPGTPSFFTKLGRLFSQVLAPQGTITDEILGKTTSLKGKTITSPERTSDFFKPYLKLPDNITAARYTIGETSDETSITVYEVVGLVDPENPFHVSDALTKQQSSDYQFNRLSPSTFYLNQVPLERKTHNFLSIIINNVLYGFQYKALEHQKVLEIIDALQPKK